MIKRIALYGVLTGVGLIWGSAYVLDRAITNAVNGAWRKA